MIVGMHRSAQRHSREGFAGFRERLMADPSFFVKVGIECGIGIGTKCAAEREKRKGRFVKELDFVTANVIMAIIADFMLVWLPAPTMSFATANSCRTPPNAIARFFSCCPDNAFQKVPEGAHLAPPSPAPSNGACTQAALATGRACRLPVVDNHAAGCGATAQWREAARRRLWCVDAWRGHHQRAHLDAQDV